MKTYQTKATRRGDSGQTLVEFALVAALFFTLAIAIFDLGRGVLYYNMLSNAAREGARLGIAASRTSDQICARAKRATLMPGVDLSDVSGSRCGATGDLTVQVLDRGTPGNPSDPVRVTASYTFRLVIPLIGNLVEETPGCQCITLQASSSMYVEN
jgi:Flp pilus assembly protein TadG